MSSVATREPIRHTGHCDDVLDAVVTCRKESLFATDLDASRESIDAELRGRRVLVVGGAGSIGSATTKLLLDYLPSCLHVVDQNENELAELVRDLRARPRGMPELDFRALPLDYGGSVTERLLRESCSYDVVLNFAALKHVRSEKDVYSSLQMIDTNIVRHFRFKTWLAEHGHARSYFAVSSDKAANPTSLMGATKRLMEHLIFAVSANETGRTTSARFANVAFSKGSLLESFRRRLHSRQPLALPRDTRRYFISQGEAAEICLLTCCVCPNGYIAFPRMDAEAHLQTLEAVAVRILGYFQLTPLFYEDAEDARANLESLALQGRWPVLLTSLNTSGEKPYEEFVGNGESTIEIGLSSLLALAHAPNSTLDLDLLRKLERMVANPHLSIGKTTIVDALMGALPDFQHIETGRNLDQRL